MKDQKKFYLEELLLKSINSFPAVSNQATHFKCSYNLKCSYSSFALKPTKYLEFPLFCWISFFSEPNIFRTNFKYSFLLIFGNPYPLNCMTNINKYFLQTTHISLDTDTYIVSDKEEPEESEDDLICIKREHGKYSKYKQYS